MSDPLLLVVDGNSLTHRAYHAAPFGALLDGTGDPVWALHGLVLYIGRAAARLRPDALIVGFDCPDWSVRKAEHPLYKAQRPAKPAALAEQLAAAPVLLQAAGIATVVVPGHEADDVLASAAYAARDAGWRCIAMTSDRDAFALVDASTSILRVRNGGLDEAVLVTPESLFEVYGVHPWQYRDYAALRGDPSDNLPGVRGFGAATAARFLSACGTLDAFFDDPSPVRAALGGALADRLASVDARAIIDLNRSIMRLRAELPLPPLESTRLPVDRFTMRQALSARGINLGPSLWALTGGAPPPEAQAEATATVPLQQPWVWRRSARRAPAPGQLALF